MPSLLTEIEILLASVSDTPALDASVLLAHILQKPRTWVLTHPELITTYEQQLQLANSIKMLEKGEPFPYVLGHWEFFGLDFEVTPDVLIPRPETELLVEKAIAWLQKNPDRRNIADVGTGSGAIAVSLAVNVSDVNILATDISPKTLEVAKRNAEKHGVSNRIEFMECDLLPHPQPFSQREKGVDLLCANLPYIPTATLHNLPIFKREPTLALDGGSSGLSLIEKLMKLSQEHLMPNALLLLEFEATLGGKMTELASRQFPSATIALHQDLTGRDRLLEIQT